jgi:hypothetical protein
VEADDEPLLGFAYRFLRQVLFGERTVEEIAGAWEQRMETRKEVWDAADRGRSNAAWPRRIRNMGMAAILTAPTTERVHWIASLGNRP